MMSIVKVISMAMVELLVVMLKTAGRGRIVGGVHVGCHVKWQD